MPNKKKRPSPTKEDVISAGTPINSFPLHWSDSNKKGHRKPKHNCSDRDLWDLFSKDVAPHKADWDLPYTPPVRRFCSGSLPDDFVTVKSAPPFIPDKKRPKGRRLKKQSPTKTLDLHGVRLHEAPQILWSFLDNSYQENLTIVRIITGKSLSRLYANDGPRPHRLRDFVPLLLNNPPFSGIVRCYQTAPLWDGGDGVLYVSLKKKQAV